jgi:hypothetical protein
MIPVPQVVAPQDIPAPQVVDTPEPCTLLVAAAATLCLLVARSTRRGKPSSGTRELSSIGT